MRRQLCNNVTVAMGVDGAMSSDGQAAGFPDRAVGKKRIFHIDTRRGALEKDTSSRI